MLLRPEPEPVPDPEIENDVDDDGKTALPDALRDPGGEYAGAGTCTAVEPSDHPDDAISDPSPNATPCGTDGNSHCALLVNPSGGSIADGGGTGGIERAGPPRVDLRRGGGTGEFSSSRSGSSTMTYSDWGRKALSEARPEPVGVSPGLDSSSDACLELDTDTDPAVVLGRLPSNAVGIIGIGGRPGGGERDVIRGGGVGSASGERPVYVERRDASSSSDTDGTSASEYRTSSIGLSSASTCTPSSDIPRLSLPARSDSCSTGTSMGGGGFRLGGGLCGGAGTGTGGTASSLSLSSCVATSRLADAGGNPVGGSIPNRIPPIPANLAEIRCFLTASSSSSFPSDSVSSGGIDVGGGAGGKGGRERGFIGGGAPNRIPPKRAMRSAIARRRADASSSWAPG